jgi:hypothetical protein
MSALAEVLQHGLVEGEIGDQLLQSPDLGQAAHTGKLLPSPVDRGSLTPSVRQISSTELPASACRKAKAICSSLNYLRFMGPPAPGPESEAVLFQVKLPEAIQRGPIIFVLFDRHIEQTTSPRRSGWLTGWASPVE